MAASDKSPKTSSTDAPKSKATKISTATSRRLRARLRRTRASSVRTPTARRYSPYARPIGDRIARRTSLSKKLIPSSQLLMDASVPEQKEGRQVAATLTGISEIVFRHSMAFNNDGDSLDQAYARLMAEIGQLETQETDANAHRND